MGVLIRGRPIASGAASGLVLATTEPLSFWGGYDQRTGEIIDRRHPLSGAVAAGRVLVLPASRGSSTTSAVLLEAALNGVSPAAIVTTGADRFLAIAAIVAGEMFGKGVPIVAVGAADLPLLRNGAPVVVREDGTIEVGEPAAEPGDQDPATAG